MEPGVDRGRRTHELLLPVLLSLALIAVAFARNRTLTSDLDWPAFETQSREVASAQTLLDDGFGPDYSYKGEYLWYNPLTGLLVAAVSRVTGEPPPVVVPRLGTYVNLLAPLAFFILTLTLADAWAALPATAGFLFIVGSGLPDYIAATYSPWLLPLTFTQALCYAALLGVQALHSSRALLWHHAFVGLLLGLTFLGHTAPALLVGTVLVASMFLRTRRDLTSRRACGLVGVTLLSALVVSAPFLYFIGGKYLLRVVNWYPNASPYGRLDPNEVWGLVRDLLNVPVLMGAAGGVAIAWRRRQQAAGWIMGAWPLSCAGFIGYHWLIALAGRLGVRLHTIVPSFHFLFYLHAWLAVGFGVAVAFACRMATCGVRTASLTRGRRIHLEQLLICSMTALLVAAYWPVYAARGRGVREEALRLRSLVALDAWDWIRRNTVPSDVFLSTDHMSLFVVNPAGRKVVATDRYFSSPYVDWDVRDRDRSAMFEFLQAHDRLGFEALARRYEVQFVIWSDDISTLSRGTLGMRRRPSIAAIDIEATGLHKVFQGRGVAIFRTGISVSRSMNYERLSRRPPGAPRLRQTVAVRWTRSA